MKPIIGITCNYDPRDTVIGVPGLGLPGQDWEFLAADYIYTIEKRVGFPPSSPIAGKKEILLPFSKKSTESLSAGGMTSIRSGMVRVPCRIVGGLYPNGMNMTLQYSIMAMNTSFPCLESAAAYRS